MRGPVPNPSFNEVVDRVRNAIGQMPKIRRNVFLLSRLDGLTYEKIAEQYGIPVGCVRAMVMHSVCEARHAMDSIGPPGRWLRLRWWIIATRSGLRFRSS